MSIQNTHLQYLYTELKTRCRDNCGLLLTEEVFTTALQEGLSKLQAG